LLSGRVSTKSTLSPIWHSFFSSWAFTFVLTDVFLIDGMTDETIDHDDDGLIHFITHTTPITFSLPLSPLALFPFVQSLLLRSFSPERYPLELRNSHHILQLSCGMLKVKIEKLLASSFL